MFPNVKNLSLLKNHETPDDNTKNLTKQDKTFIILLRFIVDLSYASTHYRFMGCINKLFTVIVTPEFGWGPNRNWNKKIEKKEKNSIIIDDHQWMNEWMVKSNKLLHTYIHTFAHAPAKSTALSLDFNTKAHKNYNLLVFSGKNVYTKDLLPNNKGIGTFVE